MNFNYNLVCPIRGPLDSTYFSKDNLTITEEARRIDCIKFLLGKSYPKENFQCETIVIQYIGNNRRNSLRADIVIYDISSQKAKRLDNEERNKHILLIAEIKRDSKNKKSGIKFQLEPAMRQSDRLFVLGVYWDDVNRYLYVKQVKNSQLQITRDELGNIPEYGNQYKYKKLKYKDLIKPEDIIATLMDIANILRSNQINDDTIRYRETVKLLLAKYIDEREAKETGNDLIMQVIPGTDTTFTDRVKALYVRTARIYSKAESIFGNYGFEVSEKALKEMIRKVQGLNLLDSSSDSMQQVFMTFVPAVFKKDLDQYFTPLTLVNCMVNILRPGPNDKVADPAMGTADFLSATMQYRLKFNDGQIINRVYGSDKDPQAYELAVINMALNKDGQTNLINVDTIENYSLWNKQMDVILCNPPFGSRTLETRTDILKHYDLGHVWEYSNGKWIMTNEIMPSQQLGILFIERCFNLMAEDNGRLGIILPEGYLCTASYGYVRQWIISNLKILGLVELPRRIFLKSDVDLRSNILFAKRKSSNGNNDYPIHAELVRKVGYKMGKGFQTIPKRDENTGLEFRDLMTSEILIDTDFQRVNRNFEAFINIQKMPSDYKWDGAKLYDIYAHPHLDMKPRRLTRNALLNLKSITSRPYKRLFEVADIIEDVIEFSEMLRVDQPIYLVEGQDIRALEGSVVLRSSEKRWQVEVRKTKKGYHLRNKDIVIGLVRPERRNIGLFLDDRNNVFGSSDGVAIIRQRNECYPIEWIFHALRIEESRIQFWTESGGTSYGKLSIDQIKNVFIAIPSEDEIAQIVKNVRLWALAQQQVIKTFDEIWDIDDKRAILNSPIIGLESSDILTESNEIEDENV
jgi:type I restriction enzyme M protein